MTHEDIIPYDPTAAAGKGKHITRKTKPKNKGSAAESRVETSASRSRGRRTTRANSPTKADAILKLLRSAKGASIETMIETTDRQAHSVRGFLSGVVKKKLGVALASETGKGGVRRYRIEEARKAG